MPIHKHGKTVQCKQGRLVREKKKSLAFVEWIAGNVAGRADYRLRDVGQILITSKRRRDGSLERCISRNRNHFDSDVRFGACDNGLGPSAEVNGRVRQLYTS